MELAGLCQIALGKPLPGVVIDTKDHNTILLALDSKDDAMREVQEMPDLEGEFVPLRDFRTTLRQIFQRVDRLDKSATGSRLQVPF